MRGQFGVCSLLIQKLLFFFVCFSYVGLKCCNIVWINKLLQISQSQTQTHSVVYMIRGIFANGVLKTIKSPEILEINSVHTKTP